MTDEAPKTAPVPIAWEALEDAFENNSPEVHSYLQLGTGEVLRIVDGVADPAMHARVIADPLYLRIDPVSSREQYRWMERFIATVDDLDLRHNLLAAIDGKGAFRRFKDALMGHPVDRERWFTFRSERLRACMEAWLTTHGISAAERPAWRVPDVVLAELVEAAAGGASSGTAGSDGASPATSPATATGMDASVALRSPTSLLAALTPSETETVLAFASFLLSRRPRGASSEGTEG